MNVCKMLTSPLPSASNMSMTLCTSGFCCSSGSDMNSSMESAPELSRSSLRNRLPSRRISSASTVSYTTHMHRYHTYTSTSTLPLPAARYIPTYCSNGSTCLLSCLYCTIVKAEPALLAMAYVCKYLLYSSRYTHLRYQKCA